MTIAREGLKVKVKVVGQANAVGPTLIKCSFSKVVGFTHFRIRTHNILVGLTVSIIMR